MLRLLALVDRGSAIYLALLRGLQQVLYDDDFRRNGTSAFVGHNELMRARVPRNLLLEYRVQQGWGPLGDFLGKEIPNEEFPRSNDRDAFWRGCRARDARVARSIGLKLVVGLGVVGLSWWIARMCPNITW